MRSTILVAITGASGSIYGLRLVEQLVNHHCRVLLTVSANGVDVCREETGLDLGGDLLKATERLFVHLEISGSVSMLHPEDLFTTAASGSSAPAAMVIAPASMGSIARIANGISSNLIERSADVMLKERKPLIIIPRETPLSDIHLENMLKLTRSGALILPAMPAFYHSPENIIDMVDFIVGKAMDVLKIEHNIYKRWLE